MKYDTKEIGNLIRNKRENAGYTQTEFGVVLGVALKGEKYDRKTVARWEKGERLPELNTMLKMCDMFDCDLDHLLGTLPAKTYEADFIMNETGLTEEAIAVLRNLSQVPPKETLDDSFTQFVASKYIRRLISYMLTDGKENLTAVVRRMIDLNMSHYDLRHLSETETQLYTMAYDYAMQQVRAERHPINQPNNTKGIFVSYIKNKLTEHADEYGAALKEEMPSALYDIIVRPDSDGEKIYVADAPNEGLARRAMEAAPEIFDLMDKNSDNQIEIMDFLNSRDLYAIVKDFNESVK